MSERAAGFRLESRRQLRAPFAAVGSRGEVSFGFAFGLILTAAPILLHLFSQPAAIAFTVLSGLFVGLWFDEQAPLILFVSYTFQTVFVALASSQVTTANQLEPLKSYDFILTLSMWLPIVARAAVNWPNQSRFIQKLLLATVAILAIGGLYFVAGLRFNAKNSIIYMRNVGLPAIICQLCLLSAARHTIPLRQIVRAVLLSLVICGYIELFDLPLWLDLTNGWRYLDLSFASQLTDPYWLTQAKQTGVVITGPLDFLKVNFLNMSYFGKLGLVISRLQGPNFHPISFGYSLATFMIFALLHSDLILGLAAIPLLLFASAKGAIVLALVSTPFAFMAESRFRPLAIPILTGVLAIYAVWVFILGRDSGDFHVLGLMGGVDGFIRQPWGHSLGQGGNLSTNFAKLDWSQFQHQGAADTALESAIGVMLFQMGVAAFPILAIYLWIASVCWRLHDQIRSRALAISSIAIPVILVNGIFQEEALFAPLALGLLMAFVGMTLGSVNRLSEQGVLK